MTVVTALPTAQEAAASVQQTEADPTAKLESPIDGEEVQKTEGEEQPKSEKTEAERERERLRRGIDRKTRQAAEARAERDQLRVENERLRAGSNGGNNQTQQDDGPLTLSRAELAQFVKSEAEKLAPTLRQQNDEIEHRRTVVEGLAKDLGQERFDALADDLDEALGGLQRNGRATPATEAIFAADDPQAVMHYLADPEHADEADSIGRMGAVQAGRAIAKLEAKLEKTKAEGKPQRSNAAEPIEPSRGAAASPSNMPDPANTKAWIKWSNEQERRAKH